jgi:aspartate kinase
MITVLKFGGTSVGSAEALIRAAKIIVSEDGCKVVVVSAMSGITNFLVNAVDDKNANVEEVLKSFRERHLEAAKQLFDAEQMKAFMKEFEERFAIFKNLLVDKSLKDDPFYRDNVTSQGERFSSLMLAHVLMSMGYKSVALTSEMAGIVATGKPLSGSCDLIKTSQGMSLNVKPLLQEGYIPVITGFYGVNENGKPLTFGRGGSDYAAAAVGNAIDADTIEIWTDVNGFMSADPRMVPDAVSIDEMNFNEAAELAHFGAKVLHPRTIEPARTKHIPIRVKNSFHPEHPGTLIHHLHKPRNATLTSVAMKVDLSIITISSGEIAYKPSLVARILEKIAQEEIIVYAISTSLSTIALLIHNLDVKRALKQLNTLENEDVEHIDVKSNVALICAVGDSLLDKRGLSGDVFGAVKEADANVEMISEGASDVSLNFVVPTDSAVEVVKTLHRKFISECCNDDKKGQ